jgi:hypothetical protein
MEGGKSPVEGKSMAAKVTYTGAAKGNQIYAISTIICGQVGCLKSTHSVKVVVEVHQRTEHDPTNLGRT